MPKSKRKRTAKPKALMSELDFDLAAIREVKRLLKRALKKHTAIERAILKRRIALREEWRADHAKRRERRQQEASALVVNLE